MTNSISEIIHNDVIFVTGSNTTENHPIIGTFMKRAKKKGSKLIVADPRRIELAEFADIYLPIKPGSNVAMLNGMMHYIYKNNLHDQTFINSRTEGFDEMIKAVELFDTTMASDICGVKKEDLEAAARMYAESPNAGLYYAMGITQHSSGTDHVKAVANLAMLCGHVGKENAGVNPLRGQNNVQGACDMGGLPNVYPGYQKVVDSNSKLKFESAWGVELSDKLGLTIPKMMDGAYSGEVKMLYVMGENPMVSDPDLNHIEKAIDRLDFLVVQDIFLNETAEKADVVLPAACFAEKEGTFTNTERRIQRVRKAVNAPGEAKEDWLIFKELMTLLGYRNSFSSASEIMDEIASVTPQYGGVSYNRLEKESLQWPCTSADHMGTKFLHDQKFAKGIGTFHTVTYQEPAELVNETYPLILTTGRVLYHYHTRTMTGKNEGINETVGDAFVEVSIKDAQALNVVSGDRVAVSSKRGKIVVVVKVTENIKEGVVFIPFHFAEAAANRLTNAALDPVSDIPEYKVCAVKVETI
jgi:formate dehydrogenase major subunit